MIIQKIENNNNISEWRQKSAFSMPKLILPNKSVDTKDFLYHYPIANKPQVAFGRTIEKAASFEDSIGKYFKPLPKGLKYDERQIEAAKVVYDGNDPMVVFPTGTGKTAITEYTISKNMAEGKDTICTFPIKALSNEKFNAFCDYYGKENVALLTGDIKINTDAPIKIMTAEIYRNMLMGENKNALKNLGSVVHDEIHTMNDLERGEVYETSIMKTPAKVQQVFLSGTVENGQELTDWLNNIQAQKNAEEGIVNSTKKAVLVYMSPKERYVPLKHLIYDEKKDKFIPLMTEKYNISQIKESYKEGSLNQRQRDVLEDIAELGKKDRTVQNGIEILSELVSNPLGSLETLEKDLKEMLGIEEMKSKRMAAFLSDPKEQNFNFKELEHFQTKNNTARKVLKEFGELADIELINDNAIPLNENETFVSNLVRLLNKKEYTPAIIFRFSKTDCNEFQNETKSIALISREQRKEVSKTIKKLIDDGYFLGTNFYEKPLLAGSATHHAGRMPGYKKLVETIAQFKFPIITFATGTLDKGINQPTRTVVMTQYDRLIGYEPSGNPIYQAIPINDNHQSNGRAGRRGEDEIGYVIHKPNERYSPLKIFKIVTSSPDKIQSRLAPTHSFVSNFLEAESSDKGLEKIVDRSFLKQQVLELTPPQAEKRLNNMNNRFKQFANMLQSPELECFTKTDDKIIATPKGSIVAKARGIDGLLFAETILKAP
ncbi:MAG: DEAD/DEAH box helicase, partial [bacterium]